MNVRPATEDDLPEIRDVADRSLALSYDDVLDSDARAQAVEAWYGTEESSPGALTDQIGDTETVAIVAEDNKQIVGFVQAYLSGDSPRIGQIEWLHVHPDHRDDGIGDRLLEEVESALSEADADRIEGRVIEANAEGRAFYEQHGYEPGQTRRVRLASDQVAELTLVADAETMAAAGTDLVEQRQSADGETVFIARDESERGTEGSFDATYLDTDREERYGWHCSACDTLDVNMSSMGVIMCDDCGNRRLATRWDATYGG